MLSVSKTISIRKMRVSKVKKVYVYNNLIFKGIIFLKPFNRCTPSIFTYILMLMIHVFDAAIQLIFLIFTNSMYIVTDCISDWNVINFSSTSYIQVKIKSNRLHSSWIYNVITHSFAAMLLTSSTVRQVAGKQTDRQYRKSCIELSATILVRTRQVEYWNVK